MSQCVVRARTPVIAPSPISKCTSVASQTYNKLAQAPAADCGFSTIFPHEVRTVLVDAQRGHLINTRFDATANNPEDKRLPCCSDCVFSHLAFTVGHSSRNLMIAIG